MDADNQPDPKPKPLGGVLDGLTNAVSRIVSAVSSDSDQQPAASDPESSEPSPEPTEDDDEPTPRPNDAGARYYDIFYDNYVVLYNLYGRGRPRLSRRRFEELDRELLSLVGGSEDRAEAPPLFDRGTFTRIRELEYLLMDDVSESLLETRDIKKAALTAGKEPGAKETSFKLATHWSEDLRSHIP